MEKNRIKESEFFLIIFALLVPAIIYFYFLEWRTDTAYGDDLYIFQQYSGLKTFSDKLALPIPSQKLRPIHGFSLQLIVDFFQKDVHGYFRFNVAIQTLNTFIFAFICNIFIPSRLYSLFFALVLGLSRFAFFNITQLTNGGALEGLAMSFFLLSLLFCLRALIVHDSPKQQTKAMLLSLLFANFSMYTHERYITLFVFLIMVVLLAPSFKQVSSKKRLLLVGLGVASLLFNVYLKTSFYHMSFFVGTGGTQVKFSFASAWEFFLQGLFSLFSINEGPAYLVGVKFQELPGLTKIIAAIIGISILGMICSYIWTNLKVTFSGKRKISKEFGVSLLLILLFGLSLAPAVVTIRLEQRWLQASSSVLIVLFLLATTRAGFMNARVKTMFLSSFAVLFIWVDFTYLRKGAQSISLKNAESVAYAFKNASDTKLIHDSTTAIYLWEKAPDINSENAIKWSIADGYLFDFYGMPAKKVFFADSVFQKGYSFPLNSLMNFNPKKDQVFFLGYKLFDLTDEFMVDSLKYFNARNVDPYYNPSAIFYPKKLVIGIDDFNKYVPQGFYEKERKISWTNGDAAIILRGDYFVQDSVTIKLTAYLQAAIFDSVKIAVSIVGLGSKEYDPVSSKRINDTIQFNYYFPEKVQVERFKILSDTLPKADDRGRRLSFPFVDLSVQ